MTFILVGKCNHCGECCKAIMVEMKTDRTRESYCIYAYKDDDKIFCEIREAHEKGDDDFLKMIPQKHYNFWLNECRNFPNPNDPSHRPPRYNLPEKCGYKIIEWG